MTRAIFAMSDSGDAKTRALALKADGNAAYKAKRFPEAVEKYSAAIALDASEITFYTNLAAVHFETKDYAQCVEQCERAVEVGRENR